MVVVDIWGGKLSQDHVARYLLDTEAAMTLAKHELHQGYLVNLRQEAKWGQEYNFDTRLKAAEAV